MNALNCLRKISLVAFIGNNVNTLFLFKEITQYIGTCIVQINLNLISKSNC